MILEQNAVQVWSRIRRQLFRVVGPSDASPAQHCANRNGVTWIFGIADSLRRAEHARRVDPEQYRDSRVLREWWKANPLQMRKLLLLDPPVDNSAIADQVFDSPSVDFGDRPVLN